MTLQTPTEHVLRLRRNAETGLATAAQMEARGSWSSVAVVFFENGRMRSKLVDFEDIRQFGKVSGAKGLDNIMSMSKDFDLTSVSLMLGAEGVEMIRVAQDSSANPDFNVGYIWANEEGQAAMVLFNKKGTIEQVSYSLDKTE